MHLTLKPGVKLFGIRPEMVLASIIVASIFAEFDNAQCVITSATDSKHGNYSHHYKGFALDFRTRHIKQGWLERLRERIQVALGDEFQVVLEATHLHVEFDPK